MRIATRFSTVAHALFAIIVCAGLGAGLLVLPTPSAHASSSSSVDVLAASNKAIKAQQEGDRRRALSLYTEIIEADVLAHGDRLLTYVYNNRGVLHWELNNPQQALNDFSKAIDNMPDAMSYLSRGNIWVDLGDDRKAVEDYTRAIELMPRLARAYNHRAFAWLNLGDRARAEADFQRARQIDPGFINMTLD